MAYSCWTITCHIRKVWSTCSKADLQRPARQPYKVTMKPALPPLPTMYPRVQTLRSVPHLNSRQQQVKLVVKGRAAVDPSCPMADDCHVYEAGDDMCAMRSVPLSPSVRRCYAAPIIGHRLTGPRSVPVRQSVSECHTATAMGHRLTGPRSVPEPARNQYVISA